MKPDPLEELIEEDADGLGRREVLILAQAVLTLLANLSK